MEFYKVITRLILAAFVLGGGLASGARLEPQKICEKGGLDLRLSIRTDTGTSNYEQSLHVLFTGGKGEEPVGTITNLQQDYSVPINYNHCTAWMRQHGAQIPQLIAELKKAESSTKKECHKVGTVHYRQGSITKEVKVCINAFKDDHKAQLFRQLYNVTELFISSP